METKDNDILGCIGSYAAQLQLNFPAEMIEVELYFAVMEPSTVAFTNTDLAVGIDVDSMSVTLTTNPEIQPATNVDWVTTNTHHKCGFRVTTKS